MKLFQLRRCAGVFVFAALLSPLAAQTPFVVEVFKAIGYLQTDATTLTVYDPSYGVEVFFNSTVSTATQVQLLGAVTLNVPRTTTLTYTSIRGFTSESALNAALPDGSYTLAVSGGGVASNTSFTLTTIPAVPPVPISNFDELQAVTSGNFRITWPAIPGGSSSDIMLLSLQRADGTTVYSSPSPTSGQAGALDGRSTSATLTNIPIAPGETLKGYLTYIRLNTTLANSGVTVVATGNGFNVTFSVKSAPAPKPVIAAQPQAVSVALGSTAVLNVGATGTGLTYQWKKNGVAIAGATTSTYIIVNAQPAVIGSYTVDVVNPSGTTTSASAALSVVTATDPARISNLAIRSQAGTGGQTLIVGFAIGGAGTNGSKPVLIRGVGPALGAFGLTGLLADPKLEIYSTSGTKVTENDNWGGDTQVATMSASVGAFSLGAGTTRDAALYLSSVAAGSYTAQVSGVNNTTGTALAEIYDTSPAGAFTTATPRLINVAARTQVGTGGNILIAGFYLAGQTSKTVLIRAVGPTLALFGVPGTLADPKLELYSGQSKVYENDNWGGDSALASTAASVGAFALGAASKDAVLLVTLAPGAYTAQVSGVNNTTGIALVEVYEVP